MRSKFNKIVLGMFKGITIFALQNKTTMTRPEQPEPNHRFKTMQTLTTPSGNTFDYCLDSDDDCDVSSDIEAA